jgi:hypothetical protein
MTRTAGAGRCRAGQRTPSAAGSESPLRARNNLNGTGSDGGPGRLQASPVESAGTAPAPAASAGDGARQPAIRPETRTCGRAELGSAIAGRKGRTSGRKGAPEAGARNDRKYSLDLEYGHHRLNSYSHWLWGPPSNSLPSLGASKSFRRPPSRRWRNLPRKMAGMEAEDLASPSGQGRWVWASVSFLQVQDQQCLGYSIQALRRSARGTGACVMAESASESKADSEGILAFRVRFGQGTLRVANRQLPAGVCPASPSLGEAAGWSN